MAFKIKRCQADVDFSIYIRLRDKRCMRCGRIGFSDSNDRPIIGLQCSHYHGRRKEATRFDPENCDALCSGCHQYWGENREEYTNWKISRLGRKAFTLLSMRAKSYQKKDRKMDQIKVKALLKSI